jgi:hypothetical protein
LDNHLPFFPSKDSKSLFWRLLDMEAVAAASSVIGILGVIGQSVSGLAKLQKFFDEYERAPHLVKKLKGDISGLETTLLEVQKVVQLFQKAENVNSSEILKTSTATLDTQVKLCSTTLNFGLKRLKTSIQS